MELRAEGNAMFGSGVTPASDHGQYPPAFAVTNEMSPLEPITQFE